MWQSPATNNVAQKGWTALQSIRILAALFGKAVRRVPPRYRNAASIKTARPQSAGFVVPSGRMSPTPWPLKRRLRRSFVCPQIPAIRWRREILAQVVQVSA